MKTTKRVRAFLAAASLCLASGALAFPTITADPMATVIDITGTFNVVSGAGTISGAGFVAALTGTAIDGGGVLFADASRNPFTFTLSFDTNLATASGFFDLTIDDPSAGMEYTGELHSSIDAVDFDGFIGFGTIGAGRDGLLLLFGDVGAPIAVLFNLLAISDQTFEGDADVSAAFVPAPPAISLLALGLLGLVGLRDHRHRQTR